MRHALCCAPPLRRLNPRPGRSYAPSAASCTNPSANLRRIPPTIALCRTHNCRHSGPLTVSLGPTVVRSCPSASVLSRESESFAFLRVLTPVSRPTFAALYSPGSQFFVALCQYMRCSCTKALLTALVMKWGGAVAPYAFLPLTVHLPPTTFKSGAHLLYSPDGPYLSTR